MLGMTYSLQAYRGGNFAALRPCPTATGCVRLALNAFDLSCVAPGYAPA
jgi:hypothetical protein